MYTTYVYRMDPLFWCFLIEVLLSNKKKKECSMESSLSLSCWIGEGFASDMETSRGQVSGLLFQ